MFATIHEAWRSCGQASCWRKNTAQSNWTCLEKARGTASWILQNLSFDGGVEAANNKVQRVAWETCWTKSTTSKCSYITSKLFNGFHIHSLLKGAGLSLHAKCMLWMRPLVKVDHHSTLVCILGMRCLIIVDHHSTMRCGLTCTMH